MEIAHYIPPNYDNIVNVFPMAANPGVIFAYGKTIYNPSGGELPLEIFAHEKVHGERQLLHEGGVTGWWNQYLVDPEFRYYEELLAHKEELKVLLRNNKSRQNRRKMLAHIAKKLKSPLYGKMVTLEKAKKDLLNNDYTSSQ